MSEYYRIALDVLIWIPPVVFAITVHEVAHGWVAASLGDPTARDLGRLTVNPVKHIDPVGTILVPALLYFAGGFLFGWAKPVPVDIRRLRRPKQHMALVALAGPAINVAMAIAWAMVMNAGLKLGAVSPGISGAMWAMGSVGVTINLLLALLNLLPIPPLDGSKILAGLLPDRLAMLMYRFEFVGLFVVLALLVSGLLGQIIGEPMRWLGGTLIKTIVSF